MDELREKAPANDKSAGLKKKYGMMVLTDYGDAAKLTRQPSGGGPQPYSVPTPVIEFPGPNFV